MKRIFLVFVAVLIATTMVAQNKSLYWTMRVKVKMDKTLEWEKKVPPLLRTHFPQFNFMVYEVTTGPNTGSYVFSVGPMSYKDMDAPPVFPKGEAAAKSAIQMVDGMAQSLEVTHYRIVDPISDINADRKNKYAKFSSVDITVGSWLEVQAFLAKIEEVRDKNGLKTDISYLRPANSGADNRFAIVAYLEKMEELDGMGGPLLSQEFPEMYDSVHGRNAWYKDLKSHVAVVKAMHAEIWTLRPDLGTIRPIQMSSN